MLLPIEGVDYHVEILNDDKSQNIIFLHGFTGSTATWSEVVSQLPEYRIVLVDIMGHGKTEIPEDASRYTMEQQIRDLDLLFEQLKLQEIVLVGYSMGGRVALAYASTYPARLKALILESASPGLKTAEERLGRQQRDSELALKILANGIRSFVDKWENIPLFESQKSLPAEVRETVRAERLNQQPLGLANSLIGMGTGAQSSYWEELRHLELPVLLATGSLDLKFEAIAKEMLKSLPKARHEVIEAGHAIHVEKPAEFATIVDEYLRLNYQGGKS